MRSNPRFLVALLVLLVQPGCFIARANAAARGRAAAERDILEGQLRIRTYGLPSPSAGLYRELLKEKLGIDVVTVAGCVVNESLVAETDAYNTLMEAEISRRFGPDILQTIDREASERYAAKNQPPHVEFPLPPSQ